MAAWSGSHGLKWVLLTPICLRRTWEKRLRGSKRGDWEYGRTRISGLAQTGALEEERRKEKQPSPGCVMPLIEEPQVGYHHSAAAGVLSVPNHNVLGNIQYSLIGCGLSSFQGPGKRGGRPTHSKDSWEARCAGARNAGLPMPFWVWFHQDPAEQWVPRQHGGLFPEHHPLTLHPDASGAEDPVVSLAHIR